MKNKMFASLISMLFTLSMTAQVDLVFKENKTLTYDSVLIAYRYLAQEYPQECKLDSLASTDAGKPLHYLSINENKGVNQIKVLINNGIHPGESCGIDASILFAQELLEKGVKENIAYYIIPVYNIGGALNRSCCSRINQNGPEMHGFRGNANNLDLNRDFIKMDSKNSFAFVELFQRIKPHFFIDTHSSNGADYQYTMTLISTQKDKLNPVLATLMTNDIDPFLYKDMKSKDWEMTPYVNVFGSTPDQGFAAFLETPRYASGYTALHNCIGYITEAHMFKDYKDRVEATFEFLKSFNDFQSINVDKVLEEFKKAYEYEETIKEMAINWELDTTDFVFKEFKGFEYDYLKSEIHEGKRLKYYRNKPKDFMVKYYPSYSSTDNIEIPKAYILPKSRADVVERLELNGVELVPLSRDTVIEADVYYIKTYEFPNRPYEGHFLLTQVEFERISQFRKFYKGDFLIDTKQKKKRFIIQTLEPNAVDSYLRWNFFDEIFQQKEYFSSYIFEDQAAELLKNDEVLRAKYAKWKLNNPDEAKVPYNCLNYIYTESGLLEKEYLRYPLGIIP